LQLSPDAPEIESGDTPREAGSAGGLFADLVMAVRFFSVLPTGDAPHEPPVLARIALALPFASVLIGLGPALLVCLLPLIGMPALFAAGLAVGVMVFLTGAMGEDALADSADGLFGGHSRERRLEIMKDSRHGTYGVVAIGLTLILRIGGLGTLAAINPLAAGALLLASTTLGRSVGLFLSARLPPARTDGAGAAAGQLPMRHFVFGAGMALVLLVILAGPFAGYIGIILAALAATGVIWGWTALCAHKVGGQTGDLAGAGMVLVELAVLGILLTTA
jgi:adenosylcobinamide-GDP ribazoletransferase